MHAEAFDEFDSILRSDHPAHSVDFLISHFCAAKEYRLMFEARLLKKRLELGLPPMQNDLPADCSAEVRAGFNQEWAAAARQAGELYLANGQIESAWPYFQVLGDLAPLAAAIEQVQPTEGIDGIIRIAFEEGVHPAKGLELLTAQYGICRAITYFGMNQVRNGREDCIRFLIRNIHDEIVDRMGTTIESQEGTRPATSDLVELMSTRDWLFGEYTTYVDTSHLLSILPYSPEVTDAATLRMLRELCEYGKHLSADTRMQGEPPFEDVYADYGEYIQALLGDAVEARIAHFRNKLAQYDPERTGTGPAQILVNLLARLQRYGDALEVSLQYLPGIADRDLFCPSALQLCQLAENYNRLRELARHRGDLLSYAAAGLVPLQNSL
jgi:hypothetical protein